MSPANVAEDIAKVKSDTQRIDLKRFIFDSPGFEQLLERCAGWGVATCYVKLSF
jgi:hypothetical protein